MFFTVVRQNKEVLIFGKFVRFISEEPLMIQMIYLEDSVVQRIKVGEEVEVATGEDHSVDDLRLQGKTFGMMAGCEARKGIWWFKMKCDIRKEKEG